MCLEEKVNLKVNGDKSKLIMLGEEEDESESSGEGERE